MSYTRCASQYKDAPQKAFEQIDLIHRMIEYYPETFELATTAQGVSITLVGLQEQKIV